MPIFNVNVPTEIDNNLTASTTRGASKTAINTGLSNTLTAATDYADLAIAAAIDQEIIDRDNAIASAVALLMSKAITNVTPGTIVTGTTSITISQVATVPANYFEPGEILQLDTGSSYSSVIAQKVLRTYINTSESLTGAFLLAMSTQAANTRSSDSSRRLVIQDATTTKVYGVTNSAVSSELISTVDRTSHNIPWTSEQKILNTLQLSNGGDSGFCDYIKLAP